jgi:anti-anti-sigma factor
MPGIRNPLVINGLPVVTTPAEFDFTAIERLRRVLLGSAGQGYSTIVVDMTGTRFCDSAGLNVLVRAHRRALTDGGELRVVIPPDSPVFRVFTLMDRHRLIPWFAGLDQAIRVPPRLASADRPPRPHPARAYLAEHRDRLDQGG